MLHYISLFEREYYQNGIPRRDYQFTSLEADRETVSILAKTVLRLGGIGLKALILGLNPVNKYQLPR